MAATDENHGGDHKPVKTGHINDYQYAYEANIQSHASKVTFKNQASNSFITCTRIYTLSLSYQSTDPPTTRICSRTLHHHKMFSRGSLHSGLIFVRLPLSIIIDMHALDILIIFIYAVYAFFTKKNPPMIQKAVSANGCQQTQRAYKVRSVKGDSNQDWQNKRSLSESLGLTWTDSYPTGYGFSSQFNKCSGK